MIVLRRLTLLACAVAFTGCAETQTNGRADTAEQLTPTPVSQATVDEVSVPPDTNASTQEYEEPTSDPARVTQSVNPSSFDSLTPAASPHPPQNEAGETNSQESSKSEIPEQQSTFNKHMTAVHRAIEQKNWEEASRLLEKALLLEPTSVVAQDLRDYVANQQELLHQQNLANRFAAAVQKEAWTEASEIAKNMKTKHPATLEQVQRSKTLVNAENLADQLLSDPKRLSRPSVQAEVSRLQNLTENLDPGKRVGEKLFRLSELSHLWTTPVEVNLNSDGVTTVILRPGRSLGQFRSQKIQLMPGEYVLIGRREGFREIRRSLRLDPNSEPKNIEIKAMERF